jgi:hypothetical protein
MNNMTKKETRRNRKRRRKLMLALIMIMLLVATLGVATYAWFTANRTVSVEAITVNVSTSQGLQISTDATNWKSIVTNNDILTANWSGVTNQIPGATIGTTTSSNTLSPVSTIGEIDYDGTTNPPTGTGFMKMFKGTVQADTANGGGNILVAERSTEAGSTTAEKQAGDFIVFDLFFQSSASQTVYLTSNSSVVTNDATDKGIQNAARVAFIKEGNTIAYTDQTPTATAQSQKAGVLQLIWEPNYDVHLPSAVQNANDVYHIQNLSQTGASKIAYKGVKAPIAASNSIPLDSTSTTYFGDVTTTESPASGIPAATYISAFTVGEGITKIRVYMWIEGQDVDCEDHASGSSLTFNLQFSIDSGVQSNNP